MNFFLFGAGCHKLCLKCLFFASSFTPSTKGSLKTNCSLIVGRFLGGTWNCWSMIEHLLKVSIRFIHKLRVFVSDALMKKNLILNQLFWKNNLKQCKKSNHLGHVHVDICCRWTTVPVKTTSDMDRCRAFWFYFCMYLEFGLVMLQVTCLKFVFTLYKRFRSSV